MALKHSFFGKEKLSSLEEKVVQNMSQGIRLFTQKVKKKKIFPMMSGRQCFQRPSIRSWPNVRLMFHRGCHSVPCSQTWDPSNVSMTNNRTLVHRIIDLNGKGKILVSSMSSYQFLFQKVICYEKIEVSHKVIPQNEITKYEVQVMILGKLPRFFVAILHLSVCSVWIVYGVYFLDIGICICFETIPW